MGVKVNNSEGGNFVRPLAGLYKATCTAIEEAPPFENSQFLKPGQEPKDTWRFIYSNVKTYPDGEPAMGRDGEGNVSPVETVDPRCNQTLGKNATARIHFSAILNRQLQDNEDSDDLIAEAIGKDVLLQVDSDGKMKPIAAPRTAAPTPVAAEA